MKKIIYDIEIYPNRICVGMIIDGKIKIIDTLSKIKKIPVHSDKYLWIGFNNRRYDHPILIDIIDNDLNQDQIYSLSKSIISGNDVICWNTNVLDLLEICPKMAKCSLKEIGHRLMYSTLANLPYSCDKSLNNAEWREVKQYNIHDLKITNQLCDILWPEYEARQSLKDFFDIKTEFGGAPNLAQKAILSGFKENDRVEYDIEKLYKQNNLKLSSELLAYYNEAFDLSVKEYSDGIRPGFMQLNTNINGCGCDIKVGGLHGNTYTGVYEDVFDYDVVSYYPSIILQCELGSQHFRDLYQKIYDRRLFLKSKKDPKANALKLVLNSLYGKLNDHKYGKYKIFAPNIALSICLLGQFYLIDLMEKLDYGQCLMANTDGIICTKPIPNEIIIEWEKRTGFTLECTKYKKIIIKDVNSYMAIDYDGKEKRKKEFLNAPDWSHNINAPIIQEAVISNILNGVEIKDTITKCKRLYDFCFFKKAKKDNCFLMDGERMSDSRIRFYAANNGYVVENKTEKRLYKLIASSPIKLAMNLTPIDENTDINYDWYIGQALKFKERIFKNVKPDNDIYEKIEPINLDLWEEKCLHTL